MGNNLRNELFRSIGFPYGMACVHDGPLSGGGAVLKLFFGTEGKRQHPKYFLMPICNFCLMMYRS
jgi:hypothetical protein